MNQLYIKQNMIKHKPSGAVIWWGSSNLCYGEMPDETDNYSTMQTISREIFLEPHKVWFKKDLYCIYIDNSSWSGALKFKYTDEVIERTLVHPCKASFDIHYLSKNLPSDEFIQYLLDRGITTCPIIR